MLVEREPLPSARVQRPLRDQYVEGHSDHLCFRMPGYVIVALGRMVPLRTLGDGHIHPEFDIGAEISAIVLVNRD